MAENIQLPVYHSSFPRILCTTVRPREFLLELKNAPKELTKNDLPKINFQQSDYVLQRRFIQICSYVIQKKLLWSSTFFSRFIKKMPRLLFAKLVNFEDGKYFPNAYAAYREMDNFIIVTKQISWMKVVHVPFFKLIDCSVLAHFSADFPSIEVLEQLLPLLLNLKHLTIDTDETKRTIFSDVVNFKRMLQAVSKLSKLESLTLGCLNLPNNWENILFKQIFGKHFKNVQIELHQKNGVLVDGAIIKAHNDSSSFKVKTNHHHYLGLS